MADEKKEKQDIQSEVDVILESAGTSPEGVLGDSASKEGGSSGRDAKPFSFSSFATAGEGAAREGENLDLIMDVTLDVKIELGRTQMYVEDILRLGKGSVVPLDKLAGDPVDVMVNGKLVARGEVLVLHDNFCVRITEIVDPKARMENAV